MAISVKDFGDFFDTKKNGTYKCPFCAHETFVANGNSDGDVSQIGLLEFNNNALTNNRHDSYSITCTNCGHIDLFHRNQVDQWIIARSIEKKDG